MICHYITEAGTQQSRSTLQPKNMHTDTHQQQQQASQHLRSFLFCLYQGSWQVDFLISLCAWRMCTIFFNISIHPPRFKTIMTALAVSHVLFVALTVIDYIHFCLVDLFSSSLGIKHTVFLAAFIQIREHFSTIKTTIHKEN